MTVIRSDYEQRVVEFRCEPADRALQGIDELVGFGAHGAGRMHRCIGFVPVCIDELFAGLVAQVLNACEYAV